MKSTYRAIVRRTVITDTVVEVDADDLRRASGEFDAFARNGSQRGVRIVRPFDDDPSPETDLEVIEIKERR